MCVKGSESREESQESKATKTASFSFRWLVTNNPKIGHPNTRNIQIPNKFMSRFLWLDHLKIRRIIQTV
jgi:hypothetical protein